jgi:hypothetical protein
MNMMPKFAILAAALLAFGTSPGLAQPVRKTSELINEQLDKRIELKLDNTPLPQVLSSITDQTGVPVRPTQDVYDLLPYGRQTPITATIENLTLHDALEAMASKLGLLVERREEYVELAPHPALRRIGRRATLQELHALDVLNAHRLKPSAQQTDALSLTRQIDAALLALNNQADKLAVEIRVADAIDPAKSMVTLSMEPTLADALDAIAAQTKLTWYPWGDSIVVLPKKSVIRARLDQSMSLRYDGVDIMQVLTDLSKRTGVDFMIEPGAIQRVTPEFRIIQLSADAPVRQSLESLQGYTGLGYVITDEGVYIWNQNSTPAGSRGRVVATIETLSGANVLVYEDDLSDKAQEALRQARQKAIDSFEKYLETPATTQPNERPAEHHN